MPDFKRVWISGLGRSLFCGLFGYVTGGVRFRAFFWRLRKTIRMFFGRSWWCFMMGGWWGREFKNWEKEIPISNLIYSL